VRLGPSDWIVARLREKIARASAGDVGSLRELAGLFPRNDWQGQQGKAYPPMRLANVDFTLPKIVVLGGPLQTGYTTLDGYLFAQCISLTSGLVCVDLHDEYTPGGKQYPREKRILAVIEPPEYTTKRGGYQDLSKLADTYSEVWTFIPEMLAGLPNARPVRLAEKWVQPRGPDSKRFEVSAVISHKTGPAGTLYALRQDMLKAERSYTVPTRFFNPTGHWLGQQLPGYTVRPLEKGANPNFTASAYFETKQPAFEAMFSVAVENTDLPYYVTEKLVDCFATHTVPLYVGDPALGDEFDESGIIRLDRTHWLDQINALTPDDYTKRLNAVRSNFEKSKRYWSFQKSLLSALRESGRV
jgi:hypothetical protein